MTPDPWLFDLQAEQERATLQLRHRLEVEAEDAKARRSRRDRLMTGIGYLATGIIVATTLLTLAWLWWSSVDRSRQHETIRIKTREEARTTQVEACTRLVEPLDRQYCLLALNFPTVEPEREATNE